MVHALVVCFEIQYLERAIANASYHQGILMATPARLVRREALARLWAHESLRVFHDRLISSEDKAVLRRLLAEAAQTHLPSLLHPDELSGARPLLYGDFHVANIAVGEREYGEVSTCNRITQLSNSVVFGVAVR